MFEFCGYKALAPVVTFEPVRLDDKARANALESVTRRITAALNL